MCMKVREVDGLGIREIFQRARQEAPCLLIFEDLDSLIDDANRSFFLNEVDGLEDNDGLLLVSSAFCPHDFLMVLMKIDRDNQPL